MSDVTPRLDLRPDHWNIVRGILRRHVPDRKVLAFGSRATWTAKDYSDLDLAVLGDDPLPLDVASALAESFVESDLPFKVDVVDWASTSKNFREVIERDYVVLVEKEERRGVDEWKSTTLDDLIEIKHGFAFKGHSIHEKPCGDVLLTPGNFAIGGGFKNDKFKYYDGSAPEEYILDEGDLLVTMTDLSKQSDTLGYPAYVPSRTDGRRYLHNQRLGKISLKEASRVDGRYIYYVMCGTEYRHEVLASATGTTVKHTSPDRIKQFRFLLPPLPEQRAIAHILGKLDNKIELNRRMNETLESMARALFKSWFVDFDPVRAKMEDRDTGLPKHIADLFPERMVNSDLGEIPEGWEVGVLDDAIEIHSGGTPKTSIAEYWDEDIPWYTPKDAPSSSDMFALKTERMISEAGVENSAAKVLPARTTVITARGTVGRLACLGRPMAINQTCYGIRGAHGYPNFFTYLNIQMTVDDLQRRTHGTIFDTITRQTFKTIGALLPPTDLAKTFESAVNPMMERILSNLRESHSLVDLRDALLPKLISGELRTRKIEVATP